MWGHALRHVRHQCHRAVAKLSLVVGGHQAVMPWPVLTAGPIQPLQGNVHVGRWRGGVRAILEPRKRTRELSSCLPLPNGSLQSWQVPPKDAGNRVPPGLRPLGSPLEGDHDHVGGQGLTVSCSATCSSVSTAVPRGAVKVCPPPQRMVTQPHMTTMVSQLGPGPDFGGHITTGGHGPFAAHNLYSTPAIGRGYGAVRTQPGFFALTLGAVVSYIPTHSVKDALHAHVKARN